MSTITTKDGAEIYYKDWGPKSAPPIVFHHGWPLSCDDWDTQLLYFVLSHCDVLTFAAGSLGAPAAPFRGHPPGSGASRVQQCESGQREEVVNFNSDFIQRAVLSPPAYVTQIFLPSQRS
jgi:pimeloyl-ACP methyl ester carboxylesterase